MITSAAEFTRLRLSDDPSEQARATHEAMAHHRIWQDIIAHHPDLKIWVVRNKTVPLDVLRQLALDADPRVRREVAGKRKLDRALFLQLVMDADESVRTALQNNAKLPIDLKRGALYSRHDAYQLLRALDAPDRLLQHVMLVGEAADLLIKFYNSLNIKFDERLITLGVAIHDAGKVRYPHELDGPGSLHEAAGEQLMLDNGVQPEIARCCVSHAAWREADVSFEELSVALADKLWKGKREADLELRVIKAIAMKLQVDHWDVFMVCDTKFEKIAAGADDRLSRS